MLVRKAQETAGVTWMGESVWTLTPQDARLIPRALSTHAVGHASPLLLKLQEDGPSCPIPNIPV